MFQSTRPRGARPVACVDCTATDAVSIHAPAWGATFWRRVMARKDQVSIHAPAWGATIGGQDVTHLVERFNPRARVGRDGTAAEKRSRGICFNPRARVGRDYILRPAWEDRHVSIHAPAWGATMEIFPNCVIAGVSIHAPAWGATVSCSGPCPRRTCPPGSANLCRGEQISTAEMGRPIAFSSLTQGMRLPWRFYGSFRFAQARPLCYEHPLRVVTFLNPHMFYPSVPVISKKIIANTILLYVNDGFEVVPKLCKLCRIQQAFENGFLHTLAIICTMLGNQPETLTSVSSSCVDIICD